MSLLRTLLWLILVAAVLTAAVVFTRETQLTDRLLTVFLTFNPRFPSRMSFEQFLTIVVVACGIVLVLVITGSLVALLVMRRTVIIARTRQSAQEVAVQHAIERLKAQVQQEYDRLIGLSTTLTQRLDKHAILQNILQAASQVTSLPYADSAVGLWVIDFETERMRFEMGIRCDETYFVRTQFEVNEPPFTRLLAARRPLRFATWQEAFPFVAAEKAVHFREANALILVPLLIERTVLGCLVAFCHPDVLKGYQEQEPFFNAAWGQLALALAIAIQGELAILDRLTGVVNQAYFFKRLTQEIDRSNRYHLSTALMMLDIDNFKAVNDTLGHPQGDAVLKIVSKLIKQEIRAIDLVARYGGEEFIVMLPETGMGEHGDSTGALVVAERIRKAVETEFSDLQKPLAITISIGVAVRRYPQDRNVDSHDLIRFADVQLYKAKTTGKNRCCVHMPKEAEPVV